MTEIHVVVRRINPALKIDLVQVGYIKEGQFISILFDAIENFPITRFLKNSPISDSLYVYHSDISNLVAACESLPGFRVEFFDNTFVLIFNFELNCNEGATEEEGKGN
jgi:hypothetical protein